MGPESQKGEIPACQECGVPLSAEEIEYYSIHCHLCEARLMDVEIDTFFAPKQLPSQPNTAMTEFVLRQELRVLQTMNDSKAKEIRELQRELKRWREYVFDLYELWKQTRD